MIIKSDFLASHLSKQLEALYFITGSEPYLQNEAAELIKAAGRLRGDCDEKTIYLQGNPDLDLLKVEIYSYSLFAEFTILDLRLDKKTLDANTKQILQQYLKAPNPRCLLIIRAPNIPHKQINTFANLNSVVQVEVQSPNAEGLRQFIIRTLAKNNIRYEKGIPELIHQYTQHNLEASAQVIEKLVLTQTPDATVTKADVMLHLTNQCEFPLYFLADTCLNGDLSKAIGLLRQVKANKTEPTLILWLLSHETRLLIQLKQRLEQNTPLSTACNQLKIWSSRTNLYKNATNRLSMLNLYSTLDSCQKINILIKTGQHDIIWIELERLALMLCQKSNAEIGVLRKS